VPSGETFGILLSYYFIGLSSKAQWRTMELISTLMTGVLTLTLTILYVEESPRLLLVSADDRHYRAFEIFERVALVNKGEE
jgi:hypothetical protein